MTLHKHLIKQNFSAASGSYDLVANIQRDAADYLVNTLLKKFLNFNPNSILDVGAGTGYVTKKLLHYFPNSIYVVNDLADHMIQQAKHNLSAYKNIYFCNGDIEYIDIEFHSLIISNMALQWVSNLDNVIKKLFDNSRILAFSCLLYGTFKEWDNIFNKLSIPVATYKYPNKLNLQQQLLALKPKKYFFSTKNFVLEFSNAINFIKYLKNLGANTTNTNISIKDLKALLEYNYKFSITYKIFFGILEKHR